MMTISDQLPQTVTCAPTSIGVVSELVETENMGFIQVWDHYPTTQLVTG